MSVCVCIMCMRGVGLTVCVSNKGLCSIVTEQHRKNHMREAMRGTFTKMFNKISQRIKSLTPTDPDNKQMLSCNIGLWLPIFMADVFFFLFFF